MFLKNKKTIYEPKNRKKGCINLIDQLLNVHLNIAGHVVEMYSIENLKLYRLRPPSIPGNVSKCRK